MLLLLLLLQKRPRVATRRGLTMVPTADRRADSCQMRCEYDPA